MISSSVNPCPDLLEVARAQKLMLTPIISVVMPLSFILKCATKERGTKSDGCAGEKILRKKPGIF
jgi:hypothetical protein